MISFHMNIRFIYKAESNNMLPFLDVLVIHKNSNVETTAYRKPTTNNIYLNWNSLWPKSWKGGTLRTAIKRAYVICLKTDLLQKELDHISFVFQKYNNFAKWVIDQQKENHHVIQRV